MKRYRSVKLDTDMEELNFFDEDEDTDDYEELENVNSEEIVLRPSIQPEMLTKSNHSFDWMYMKK